MISGRKRIKTGGRDFVKGHNMPGPGRPPVPASIKELRKLDREMVAKLAHKVAMARMTMSDVKHYLEDPNVPLIEKLLMRVMSLGISAVNPFAVEFFFKTLGIAFPKSIEISNPDGSLTPRVVEIRLPSNGREPNNS